MTEAYVDAASRLDTAASLDTRLGAVESQRHSPSSVRATLPLPRPLSLHDSLLAAGVPLPLSRRCSSESHIQQAEELSAANDPPPPSFFFTGCAWGCAYHVGAYRGMIERWGLAQLSRCSFGGNSAGSLMALAAATGASWELLEETYLELAHSAKEKGVMLKMSAYHAAALTKLVGPTTHTHIAGRLHVGVTYTSGYEVHSSWATQKELLDTLHASMHIPFYCTHIETVGGRAGVDGGLSTPYHLIDAHTFVVDPFGSSSLASARAFLRAEPFFPILGERYAAVHSEGRRAVLGRSKPAVLELHFPGACHAITWLARGAEEIIDGVARAMAVWQVDVLVRKHARRLSLILTALVVLWWARSRRAGARLRV